MKPKKIFISCANEDRRFVPLLAKLLEAHSHEPWFAADPEGEGVLAHKINEEIATADVLLAVVSSHTARSKGVTKEVAAFKASRPGAPMIPLLLERVALRDVLPELADQRGIDCSDCLLAGFQQLFHVLGSDFLSKKELMNRRSSVDRRGMEDRRSSAVEQRLAVGLVVTYTRKTGGSIAEATAFTCADLNMLEQPVREELQRYEFYDRDGRAPIDPEAMLSRAFEHVKKPVLAGQRRNAVDVLCAIAEYILQHHRVKMIDRRQWGERRGGREASEI